MMQICDNFFCCCCVNISKKLKRQQLKYNVWEKKFYAKTILKINITKDIFMTLSGRLWKKYKYLSETFKMVEE